jgi:hypothetical protein
MRLTIDPSESCSWSIHKVTPEIVFIVDDDLGGCSVTNAARRVVDVLSWTHPGKRVVYRDSEGRWDEMIHNGGEFLRFAPFRGRVPE